MKSYIKPTSISYEINTEGVIASSLPIGGNPGNQQLSERNDGWNSEDWTEQE